MSHQIDLPWPTDFVSVFLAFVGAYIIIDVIFIRFIRLSPIAWRRVDYIWLSMAFIGVLGATASGRQEVASNLLNMETSRLDSTKQFMTHMTTLYSSDGLCDSSDTRAKAVQADAAKGAMNVHQQQCDWFTQAHAHLQSTIKANEKIDLSAMRSKFPIGADKDAYFSITNLVRSYNTNIQAVADLKEKMTSTDIETNVRLLGPLMIALALGLRMAKVTAEVKMDKEKLASSGQLAKKAH
jgi:hypothetical protein